jgi:hypothetical protein
MSKPTAAGFGDVENPFGDVDLVDEYEPPAVGAGGWQRQALPGAAPLDDDEPFTAAHLAAAAQGEVPAVRAAASPRPQPPLPFTESVGASGRDFGGRIGPAPAAPPPAPRQGAALDSSLGAPPPAPAAPDSDPGAYPLYSVKRYRTYFNVDTDEVLQRVYRAVALFFKGDFVDHLGGNPDL